MTKSQLDQLVLVNDIWQVKEVKPTTFIHGDNIAFLRWCKEEMLFKHWHVGIVDPPYGIEVGSMNLGATKDSKPRDFEMGDWDGLPPTQEYWDLLNYCCRELIIWGGNYFVSNLGKVYSYQTEQIVGIKNGRCFIVWDKMNDKMSFAPGELALTTFDRNAVIIRRPRNAATVDGDKKKQHPTQKPVYLYDYLHLNFVERGQRVLDTHGGSFTHAKAAWKNGIDLTIIDKQESYFLDGIEAYERDMKPRMLF